MKQLKRIRGLKDVKLSLGSELVLYRTKGEKIEKEEKKEERPEAVRALRRARRKRRTSLS